MTRVIAGGDRAIASAASVWFYAAVWVLDSDAIWRDLSNFLGANWVGRCEFGATLDEPVMSAKLTLVREQRVTGTMISLSPQVAASPANRNLANAYVPLINPGRSIRLLTATLRPGQSPSDDLTPTDPGLELGGATWTLEGGWSVIASNPHGGANALQHVVGLTDSAARNARQIPCVEGDSFIVSGWVKGVGADGRTIARICWLDASHTEISTTDGPTLASDGVYHLSTAIGAAPAGAAFARAEFVAHERTTGTWYADDLTMTRNAWKRVFDGKIDGVDPGGDAATMVVRCRDLGAWLLSTQIETKRVYGSDTGVAVQSVMQGIINDNAVPGLPVLYTPVDPLWLLHRFEQDNQDADVMGAIRDLALQIGFDVRYLFLTDGDVDPVLTFAEPPRTKSVPDWTFGPGEYTAIPKAEITDDDVRNAAEIDYYDAASGALTSIVSINAASIAEFERRFLRVTESSTSNIDTATEATRLGDAIVADLGFPSMSHTMETLYCWFLSISDLCRFLSNNVHYDDFQDLAIVGFQHVLEGGHGTTTADCRGTPAGAYKRWLSFAGKGGPPASGVILSWELVSSTDTTITVRINATAQGSSILPPVELLWTGFNPPVTKLSGADPTVFVPSGNAWTFTRPAIGTGDSSCGFGASTTSDPRDRVYLTVPIPEATAVTGPTVGVPTIVVNPDPTDSFDISWTVGGAPAGATYKLYFRSGADGLAYIQFSAGTATSYTVPHGSDFFHIIDSGAGGTTRTAEAYVEMYDSGGVFLTQSAIGSATWQDDGFG